jgi:hypothetical protein
LLLSSVSAVLIVSSCKNEYVQQDPVCFERDVFPIISANCTQSGCHNAVDRKNGRDYSTYEGILRDVRKGDYRASSLFQVISRSSGEVMPPKPYSTLSDDQILLIATWIQEGATHDTCSMTTTCDTTGTISYTTQVKPILQTWCNGCHGGTAQAGAGIVLSTYSGVKSAVDNGSLVGSINQNSGYSPMPKNGNTLSACNLATIQKWVDAGAPAN